MVPCTSEPLISSPIDKKTTSIPQRLASTAITLIVLLVFWPSGLAIHAMNLTITFRERGETTDITNIPGIWLLILHAMLYDFKLPG